VQLSLSTSDLTQYIARQISHWFPDGDVNAGQLAPYTGPALERAEHCFSRITNKHFSRAGQTYFNHLHSDQYAMLLYFLGNTIHHLAGDPTLAAKTYLLNKALHALDLFYEVQLPAVFYFQHPVGTVLGRGNYGNYFGVYQRCTVGGNLDLVYPTLGTGVMMYGGSAIIGACTVGDNCALSVGAIVVD